MYVHSIGKGIQRKPLVDPNHKFNKPPHNASINNVGMIRAYLRNTRFCDIRTIVLVLLPNEMHKPIIHSIPSTVCANLN